MKIRCVGRLGVTLLVALVLSTVVLPPGAWADAAPFAVQQARLLDPAPETYDDEYGDAVAVYGDIAVVGRPGYDADRGAVLVYRRTGVAWSLIQTIQGAAPGDRLGDCVALDGGWLAVGAPYADTGKGADAGVVRVFRLGMTVFVGVVDLSGETITAGEHYGSAVDINDDRIVVGAPNDGTNTGSVWPYRWNGMDAWVSEGTLNGVAGDYLGSSVAVGGTAILAGAGGANTPGGVVDAGCAYAYSWGGASWAFATRLYAPDPQESAYFGTPLAMSDSGYTAVVGVPEWDATADDDNTGRAYVFNRGMSWAHQATLANPGANSPDGDWYGSSVAIDADDLAVVGAFWDDSHTGAAYYYRWRPVGWSMVQKVTPGVVSPGVAVFGSSLATEGGTLVVGAKTSGNVSTWLAGSAFVYNSRATITGVCRDALTGLPVAGAEVTAYVLDSHGEPQTASDDSLMVTGSDGRYTLSVDSGTIYLGWMGAIPYQPGWYNDVPLSSAASPITIWAGNTYTYNFSLYPVGSVFRFYNKVNGTHFYTDSWSERNTIIAKYPAIYAYEGVAYKAKPTSNPQPLYRFYSPVVGSHFYTASLTEKNQVVANLSHIYTYEGLSYRVSPVAVPGATAVYRFYNTRQGSHFYTASAVEKNQVIANLSHIYSYEGIAFWLAP